MVKNCWMNLTPFQLACVLILIVAIPFFIAMLAIYLMYGVVWHKSEECQNLCCSLESSTRLPPQEKSEIASPSKERLPIRGPSQTQPTKAPVPKTTKTAKQEKGQNGQGPPSPTQPVPVTTVPEEDDPRSDEKSEESETEETESEESETEETESEEPEPDETESEEPESGEQESRKRHVWKSEKTGGQQFGPSTNRPSSARRERREDIKGQRAKGNPAKETPSHMHTTTEEAETQIPQLFCPSKLSNRLQEQAKQETNSGKQGFLEPSVNDNTKVPNVPVAALLDKLHVDDTSYYFKCTAVVISDGWALSVSKCAKTGISAIRFGSRYWSQGGIFREVREVLHPKGTNSLALVGFMRSGVVGASVGRFWETKKVLSYNWRSKLHLPLAERKKYEPLEISEMEPRKNVSCSNSKKKQVFCYVIDKSDCDRDVNAPMFSENLQLVGFHLKTLCPENTNSSIVVYVNI